MSTEHQLYVYGIVRADHPLPAGRPGVGTPPARLRSLRAGPLAAVVSRAPERLLARRRDLLAHQRSLLALAADGPVAPMRFGMIAADADAVLGELAGAEAEHLQTLERLDGRCEMNLKVFPREDALADLLSADPRLHRLRAAARRRPGYETSVRLGEAIAKGLHRWAAGAAAEALHALSPLADAVVAGPEVTGCVRNTSFLVRRELLDDFVAEATRRADAARRRAELRLSGPLPCFSFVSAKHPATGAGPAAPAPTGCG